MQWLITIIQEWIIAQGYLTSGFITRPGTAPADWVLGDLTTDFAWHTLDCSSIVPSGAQAISFNIGIMDNAVASRLHLRRYGNTNGANRCEIRTLVANLYNFQDFTCPCDSQRRVEYRMTAVIWTFTSITIKGWWL